MNESEYAVLCEIRDLLLLIAEPQIAGRDRLRRDQLRKVIGKSEKNIKACLLMDGSRNQSAIAKEVPIDVGQLSKLVKALGEAQLLKDGSSPAIVIPVSESIFKGAADGR
jgi:DNA-binding MarR family transcriptional regulator